MSRFPIFEQRPIFEHFYIVAVNVNIWQQKFSQILTIKIAQMLISRYLTCAFSRVFEDLSIFQQFSLSLFEWIFIVKSRSIQEIKKCSNIRNMLKYWKFSIFEQLQMKTLKVFRMYLGWAGQAGQLWFRPPYEVTFFSKSSKIKTLLYKMHTSNIFY